jgi:putative polyhydroxyalkanoate system protein
VPDIHIERHHTLGLPAAREIARRWVRQVEEDYGLECNYAEGVDQDTASFARAGIDGSVEVTGDRFTLSATLGFLFSNFGEEIERSLNRKLDTLLGNGNANGGGSGPAPDDEAHNDSEWR